MSDITVIKRDGSKETLDLEKFHRVVTHACADLTGVSSSEVELKSQIQFYNNISAPEIQETLIKAAAELISEHTPNYQFVAGRLISYDLRKTVYGSFEPPSLYDHVNRVINETSLYEKDLLEWYTKQEFDIMDSWMDHSKDEHLTYAAMEQLRGKYLVKNRATGQIYETPQMAYMLIGATLFHKYDNSQRLNLIRNFYEAVSNHDISLPTPVMAGVRTT